MECKENNTARTFSNRTIGIYPEWNVKTFRRAVPAIKTYIGIYPEWNVKAHPTTENRLPTFIGIYPEWNVKN